MREMDKMREHSIQASADHSWKKARGPSPMMLKLGLGDLDPRIARGSQLIIMLASLIAVFGFLIACFELLGKARLMGFPPGTVFAIVIGPLVTNVMFICAYM